MPVSTRSRKRKEEDSSERETLTRKRSSDVRNQSHEPSPRILCGTSGYSYAHWNNGVYYPRGYSSKQWEYYSSDVFNTVELNAPFYRWQKPETWSSWCKRAHTASTVEHPFIYAVKVHQYFSHWRQLNVDDAFVAKFKGFVNDCCQRLGRHCGPLLVQFPSRFVCTDANLTRLQNFGELVQSINATKSDGTDRCVLRVALEFRHSSWFEQPRISRLMKKYDLCMCLVHLVNKHPAKWANSMLSGFSPSLHDYECCSWGAYVRFHGTKGQYEGSYSDKFLDDFLDHCRKNFQGNLFIFFNNTDSDAPPSAIRDAKYICRKSLPQSGEGH